MKFKILTAFVLTAWAAFDLAAMPSQEESDKAAPVVRKLMEPEWMALKAGKKTRGEVAEVALRLARESHEDAAKLLLMKGAFVLYVKDGETDKAIETMNAIETTIADLPPQSVTNMIELALAGMPNVVRTRLYQRFDATKAVVPSTKNRTTIQSIIDGMIKVPGKDYWLSETELTQGQWESVMGYNLSEHRGAELPAEHISRDDCDVFIEKLNQTEEAKIARLEFAVPTHQEWGRAAAAGGPGPGKGWIKHGVVGNILDMAWVQENSSNQTHAVATKAPNAWGFYDMQGNVHEWVITLPEGVGPEKKGISVFFPAKEAPPDWWWGGDPHGQGGDTGLRLAAHSRPIEDCVFKETSEIWGTADVDGYTWSYCVANGEATIAAKSGDTFVCAVSPRPTGPVAIPSFIGNARVTGIGAWSFKDCETLESIKIPETVTSVGDGAFAGCERLKSVQLPSGVESIGRWAFQGCGRLTSIAIPSKVETIAYRTFGWCRGLMSVTIPSTVRNIEGAAFIGCLELTSVTIASGVTNIGNSAFVDCGSLSSVTLPGSVRRIGANAFRGCGKLKSAILPAGVERIEWGAYQYCGELSSVVIPSTVKTIRHEVFANCGSLKSLAIEEGVTNISDRAFHACPLKSVAIPKSVVYIGEAFAECGELESVTMLGERPNAPKEVFRNCPKLREIHVPSTAKSWAGMTEWQGKKLVFDAKADIAKNRTTVQSIVDGMIKVPGKDYWLSETELTQGQWESVMGYNLSAHKGANLPVENVSRDDCDVFIEKLNQTKECRASQFAFAVPTCDEWTYAVQAGGSGLRDYWIKPGVTGNLLDMAWLKDNSSNQTYVVATKAPNAFGFYDMQGNVSEWLLKGYNNEELGTRKGCSFREASGDCNGCASDWLWYGISRNLRLDNYGLRVAAHIRSNNASTSARPQVRGSLLARRKDMKDTKHLQTNINGYTWSYRVDNGEAIIEAKKDGKFTGVLNPAPMGHITIPSSLNGMKVTAIGNGAFSEYTGLTSVTIPEGVRSIGNDAFHMCSLVSVAIPASVTNVHEWAFSCNSELMSFSVEAANPVYSSRNGVLISKDGKTLVAGVNGEVVIPSGVQTIATHAFRGHQKLTSVVIPPSVTDIEGAAFWQCRGLSAVTLPQSLKRLECSAFRETGLKSIIIPPSVTEITWSVLYGCGELTSVTLPQTITRIEGIAFMFCNKLESITIPASVKRIDGRAFGWCPALTSVTMRGECPTTPEPVFPNCPKLTSIHVPANAKSWAGMKEWQGKPLVFDEKADPAK